MSDDVMIDRAGRVLVRCADTGAYVSIGDADRAVRIGSAVLAAAVEAGSAQIQREVDEAARRMEAASNLDGSGTGEVVDAGGDETPDDRKDDGSDDGKSQQSEEDLHADTAREAADGLA